MCLDQAKAADALDPACFACRCPRNLDFEVRTALTRQQPCYCVSLQCGSDGRTYQNDCLYHCALEKCPDMTKDVIITRKGKCEEKKEKIGTETMEYDFTDD